MIKGSIVELVAPTEPNGAIKYQSLEALVDWHVVEGSAALLLGDTLDAALDLDAEERLEPVSYTHLTLPTICSV